MKCDEVIPLIQRKLDDDLTKKDQETLDDHLSSCADCHAQYQQLKGISSELEALPKVTPPVSIVDQILPMLDHIDEVRSEGKPSIKSVSSYNGEKRTQRKWLKNKKQWFPGVVVAAGVLLTLLVGKQLLAPTSEYDLMAANETESMESAQESSAATESHSMAADTATNDGENKEFGMNTQGPESSDEHEMSIAGENSSTESNTEMHSLAGSSESEKNNSKEEATNEKSTSSSEPSNSDSATEPESTKYVSPSGEFVAYKGLSGEDLRVDKEGNPYYLSEWVAPWEVEHIAWVSDYELYYVLFHPSKEIRQYKMIHVDKRTEEELDGPYQE